MKHSESVSPVSEMSEQELDQVSGGVVTLEYLVLAHQASRDSADKQTRRDNVVEVG